MRIRNIEVDSEKFINRQLSILMIMNFLVGVGGLAHIIYFR